ncbi:hypothetical protein H0I31_01060 [Tenacibaculum sp. AHE15PA]|uniref:hypothetical protein n=1 Tax=unclassified Tenacibaculum TaxID=2635139 RepID=UPI001C4EA9CA|nr:MULTISPECIES: hypothetical protein [unclassified Tenacibaculum]QXP74736.1 hypothetical protein H0I30_06320 [Tenacibaculum sp. AHE14PA]QXP76247.1 hypothetical protein H0I31_01060 [Tenacibaculum sp. AHE15PA]
MKIETMIKKIFLTSVVILISLLSFKTFAQEERKLIEEKELKKFNSHHRVTVTHVEYANGSKIPAGSPIEIPLGGTVDLKISVLVFNATSVFQGYSQLLYKKSQNKSWSNLGTAIYRPNSFMTNWVREFKITLTSNMFEQGQTGYLSAKFGTNHGNQWVGENSYKVIIGSPTPVSKNVICCDQTLEFDEIPATLTGTGPVNGNENYTYNWGVRTKYFGDNDYGTWVRIGNIVSSDVNQNLKFTRSHNDVTDKPYYIQYRRYAHSSRTGKSSYSNIITIKQNPDNLGIRNNTISTISGSKFFNGSAPAGGSGVYTYQWYFTFECPSQNDAHAYNEPITGATAKNYSVSFPWFDSFSCKENVFFHRLTKDSGGKTQYTNSINIYGDDISVYFSNRSASTDTKKKKILELSIKSTVNTPERKVVDENFNVFVDNSSEKLIVKSRITESTNLTISLTSILDGRTYKVFEDKVKKGDWKFEWDRTKGVRKGIYVCRMVNNGKIFTKKIIIK